MPESTSQVGSGAVLFAMHDEAILGHQVRLVDRVVEGTVDKATFTRNVGHLESFESLRAELRGDGGLSRNERNTLNSEMKKLAGKVVALPQNQTEPTTPLVDAKNVTRLFDELANGTISKTDAVEELYWRSSQMYGDVVAEREGPVYTDERPKLRAALVKGYDLRPQEEPGPSNLPYHKGTVDLIRKAITVFPQLDIDGNGVVDRIEARTILTNYQNLGLTAPQAATLYSRQAILAEVDSPGPASHEIMALEDLQGLLPENTGLVDSQRVHRAMSLVGSRLADQERRILPKTVPLYLNEGPDGSRVSQGLEGSCWFLGTLPALSGQELQQILTPEGDHFRMHFADGTSEAVVPMNEAERRVYSRGDGAWSGQMEKAVAQKLSKIGKDLKGGLTQDALRILTGAQCDVHFLNNRPLDGPDYRDKANLATLLQTTLENGGAVFTQVNEADFDPQISLVSDAKHAYTITAYDAETQTVSLRNPWGKGEKADRDGFDDGNFQMSLTEVAATFSLVITERV